MFVQKSDFLLQMLNIVGGVKWSEHSDVYDGDSIEIMSLRNKSLKSLLSLD